MPAMPSLSFLPTIPMPEPVLMVQRKYYEIDTHVSPLARYMNFCIIFLSILSQFDIFYKLLAFVPFNLINMEPVPYLWTPVTSVFFDSNIIYLLLHLVAVNFFIKHLEPIWALKNFLIMIFVTSFLSGFSHLCLRIFAYSITYNDQYLMNGYTSINPIVITIVMGLRQIYPERHLDTRIPFITGNLLIPFNILPQVYLGLCYLVAFLLELQWDMRILSSFYFSWFYLRFFMKTKMSSQQVGDSSPQFALHTFFPERFQESIRSFCDQIFAIVNITGVFDYIQKRFKSPLQNTNEVERKKALDTLEEEIQSLTGENEEESYIDKKVQNKSKSEENQSSQNEIASFVPNRKRNVDQGGVSQDFGDIEIRIREELSKLS